MVRLDLVLLVEILLELVVSAIAEWAIRRRFAHTKQHRLALFAHKSQRSKLVLAILQLAIDLFVRTVAKWLDKKQDMRIRFKLGHR